MNYIVRASFKGDKDSVDDVMKVLRRVDKSGLKIVSLNVCEMPDYGPLGAAGGGLRGPDGPEKREVDR